MLGAGIGRFDVCHCAETVVGPGAGLFVARRKKTCSEGGARAGSGPESGTGALWPFRSPQASSTGFTRPQASHSDDAVACGAKNMPVAFGQGRQIAVLE